MKKLILLLLAASTVTTATFAQKKEARSPLRFGIKAGANISRAGVSGGLFTDDVKSAFGPGIYGGGLLEISGPAGSKFKGQIEALYSYHTFSNTMDDLISINMSPKIKTNLSQISVPLMVKYFPIPALSFSAGASVNFNIASTSTWGALETDNKASGDLQTIQIGALVGANYYIYKGFFVDARFNYFFGSMLKDSDPLDPTYRLSAIQLGLGYKF